MGKHGKWMMIPALLVGFLLAAVVGAEAGSDKACGQKTAAKQADQVRTKAKAVPPAEASAAEETEEAETEMLEDEFDAGEYEDLGDLEYEVIDEETGIDEELGLDEEELEPSPAAGKK